MQETKGYVHFSTGNTGLLQIYIDFGVLGITVDIYG
jgi:hypothetical protein